MFVSQEIMPFSDESELSSMGRYLPAKIQEMGREIRVFMPKFSSVSERKHQLHEVIRLSGMNLIVNNCDHQLIIKVGSIPTARMQVYFIDNDEYFAGRKDARLADGTLSPDSDEQLLFFGRGTLEAVRKLAWQPHLINFCGWFTSMIPFYLRRINKENAFFSGTKMVITLMDDGFKGHIGGDLERKMKTDGATTLRLKGFADRDPIVVSLGGKELGTVTFDHQGQATLPLPADTKGTVTLSLGAAQGKQTPRISEIRLCK